MASRQQMQGQNVAGLYGLDNAGARFTQEGVQVDVATYKATHCPILKSIHLRRCIRKRLELSFWPRLTFLIQDYGREVFSASRSQTFPVEHLLRSFPSLQGEDKRTLLAREIFRPLARRSSARKTDVPGGVPLCNVTNCGRLSVARNSTLPVDLGTVRWR